MTLYAVVQRTPTPANDAALDHPTARIYRAPEDLLADAAVDVVVVATPPDSHVGLCAAALDAGKHVLVEKPLASTAAEARELAARARQRRRLLCVYQNRRWDADFLVFRRLQADGALGRVVEFESHFDRHRPAGARAWKAGLPMARGGGVLYDLGSHLLDQAVVAFGLPRRVTAVFATQRQDGAAEPDAVTVLLQYDRGLLATIKAGVISIEAEQLRFWVRGTEGSWRKGGLDPQEDQLHAGMRPGDEGFGVEAEGRVGVLTVLEGDKIVKKPTRNIAPETYGVLYLKFAEAIEKNDEDLVPVKVSEVTDVLRIIEAVIESAREGKTVEL